MQEWFGTDSKEHVEEVARHASPDDRTLAEQLELANEHRGALIALVRSKIAALRLSPSRVHVPRAAQRLSSDAAAPTFADTLNISAGYLGRVLDFLSAGITAAGEFRPPQAEFLVASGRDFRKFGLETEHYEALDSCMNEAIGEYLGDCKELLDTLNLACSLMAFGAEEDRSKDIPATVGAEVVDVEHRCSAVAVIRVQVDPPLGYWPGQHLEVRTPHTPRLWRRLSPANPYNEDGLIEFHVRAVGEFSRGVVSKTEVGERWAIANPYGELAVSGDRHVVMIAGSTGLAPLRAILLDLINAETRPTVELFFGAKNPGELYEWQTLQQFDEAFDWLSVTPVVEATKVPAGTNPQESNRGGATGVGLAVPRNEVQLGKVSEVAIRQGNWRDAEILVAGSPSMKASTVQNLLNAGASLEQILYDPVGNSED